MPQCVGKMVQVSNLYLQRGASKFQFSGHGLKDGWLISSLIHIDAAHLQLVKFINNWYIYKTNDPISSLIYIQHGYNCQGLSTSDTFRRRLTNLVFALYTAQLQLSKVINKWYI